MVPWQQHYCRFGPDNSSLREAVLCMVVSLAASLASIHQMPVVPPSCDNQTLPKVPWVEGSKMVLFGSQWIDPYPTVLCGESYPSASYEHLNVFTLGQRSVK